MRARQRHLFHNNDQKRHQVVGSSVVTIEISLWYSHRCYTRPVTVLLTAKRITHIITCSSVLLRYVSYLKVFKRCQLLQGETDKFRIVFTFVMSQRSITKQSIHSGNSKTRPRVQLNHPTDTTVSFYMFLFHYWFQCVFRSSSFDPMFIVRYRLFLS